MARAQTLADKRPRPSIGAWALFASSAVGLLVGLSPFGSMRLTALPMFSMAITALAAVAWMRADVLVAAARRWRVLWAAAAVLVVALVSALASGRVFSALWGAPGSALGWFEVACAFVVVFAASTRMPDIRAALVAAAPWVIGVEAAVALYQSSIGIHQAGTLSNSSYLAEVLVLMVPLLAVGFDRQSAQGRWIRLALAVLAIGVAMLGGARVGLVSLVAWFVYEAVRGDLLLGVSRRTRRVGAVVGAAAVLMGGAIAYRSGGAGAAEFVSDRASRVMAALGGLAQRPLLGWGPDGFFNGAAAHASADLVAVATPGFGQIAADPHNVVANVLVSLGILGAAAVAWLVAEWVRTWGHQRSAGSFERAWAWAVGLFVVQALFAPAALQVLPLAAVVAGASLRPERTTGDAPASWLTVATRVLCAIVAFALLAVSLVQLGSGREDRPHGSSPQSAQRAAETLRLDPWLYYYASLEWAYAASANPAISVDRPDLAAIRRAVALEPSNPVYATELARTLAAYGEPRAQVSAAFERAQRLFPLSPDARSSYAEYLLASGDAQAAKRELERGGAIRAGVLLKTAATVYRELGDTALADEYDRKYQHYLTSTSTE